MPVPIDEALLEKSVIELPSFPISPELLQEIYGKVLGNEKYALYNYGYHFPVEELPELQAWRDLLDLEWDAVFFSIGQKQVGAPVHKDGNDEYPFNAAINYPLLNCDSRAETVFYHELSTTDYRCKLGTRFAKERHGLIEKERIFFDSSNPKYFLFNSGRWHSVEQKGSYTADRVMFTWRFRPNITWSEAIRRVLQFM